MNVLKKKKKLFSIRAGRYVNQVNRAGRKGVRAGRRTLRNTVFDLISEHALISGHPPFFLIRFFVFFILILIITSSDFREGNTSLLYTGLMATRALTLRVRLGAKKVVKRTVR